VTDYVITIANHTTRPFDGETSVRTCVERALLGEGIVEADVDVSLIDDMVMQEANRTYLQHDYTTDVLTFPYGEDGEGIEGEVLISLAVAQQQADEYGVTLTNEVCRLAVHGVLHLCGYTDNTPELRLAMQQREDRYIGVPA
jgi:probable rRNA maturation factor